MRVLDLFSGIGGFSLAAHWLNWETIAFVEKDAFCQQVLAKNFKGVPIYDDITTFSGKPFRGRCDIITGGFPCQPFSVAGKQQGTGDERHLFPEMLRVIEEVKPTWVVAENVRGLLGVEYGDTFEEICSSLERIGYAVQTFIIPACAVNAPHRRDRLWIVADAESAGLSLSRLESGKHEISERFGIEHKNCSFTNTNGTGLQRRGFDMRSQRTQSNDKQFVGCGRSWDENWLEVATEFCRMDARVPDRVDRLRSLGNAIVPQIAFEIFKAIEAASH